MKKILAIGGAVIKTAKKELIEVIKSEQIEMLIHNGGSIFHDFQQEITDLDDHSYPIEELLKSFECNKEASDLVWKWIDDEYSGPDNSVTKTCYDLGIPVLMFTGLACDFWQLTATNWTGIAYQAKIDFDNLCERFKTKFHYVCMGSAVIHPEVFIKAVAVSKPSKFKADVVDFLDMYRPRTRVAKYGIYYQITHQEYLKGLL